MVGLKTELRSRENVHCMGFSKDEQATLTALFRAIWPEATVDTFDPQSVKKLKERRDWLSRRAIWIIAEGSFDLWVDWTHEQSGLCYSSAVVCVSRGKNWAPELINAVDLIWPAAPTERDLINLRRIFSRYSEIVHLQDVVGAANRSIQETTEKLRADLILAESMQKRRLPEKFPDLKGFKVTHRYLAGSKAGGDYFDIVESKDGQSVFVLMSDCSSYGLSSALLTGFMRSMVKIASCGEIGAAAAAKALLSELQGAMSEKDQLSLLFGTISRRDYRFRYVHAGTAAAFYSPDGKSFKQLEAGLPPITVKTSADSLAESQWLLEPGSRFALLSDGYLDAAGGSKAATELLGSSEGRQATEILNELSFRAKKDLDDPDDLPAQDCSALYFEIESRLIRRVS